MRKVLVVGGAGYVGCVLVEVLLAKGYSVRVLDRLFFGRAPTEGFEDRVELLEGDMREVSAAHMADCGAVINIGGLSNDPTAEFDPKANVELNQVASIEVARVAKAAGVPRLIFASTASIYDRGVGEELRDVLQDEDSDVDPSAAYATSKLAAEREILAMAGDGFTPMAFRKGTIFGFSPRMRYDLVVNAFVKDALSSGVLNVFYGGEMWRPLIDVEDVARAYLMALETDAAKVSGLVFNLSAGNFRIAELALRTQRALAAAGVAADLNIDYAYRMVRSYRTSAERIQRVLGWTPQVSVEESVANMVKEIRRRGMDDFSHPRYYNIEWMKVLEEAVGTVRNHGYVLSRPDRDPGDAGDADDAGGVTRIGRTRHAGSG
jgi:nucleoside-diphosphate-sugar epimerase